MYQSTNRPAWLLLLTAVAIASCAAGPGTPRATNPGLSPPAESLARLVFLRTQDSKLYILRSAPVYLDDRKIGNVGYGTWFEQEVTPARYRMTVRNWDSPGSCEVTMEAEAGKTYYLQIDPRDENFNAFVVGDIVGTLAGGNFLVELTTGLALQAAESYAQACGGLFRLYPLDAVSAQAKLALLDRAAD